MVASSKKPQTKIEKMEDVPSILRVMVTGQNRWENEKVVALEVDEKIPASADHGLLAPRLSYIA